MVEFSRKLPNFADTLMSGHNKVLIQEETFGFKRYKICTEDVQTTGYWDSGALTLNLVGKYNENISHCHITPSSKSPISLLASLTMLCQIWNCPFHFCTIIFALKDMGFTDFPSNIYLESYRWDFQTERENSRGEAPSPGKVAENRPIPGGPTGPKWPLVSCHEFERVKLFVFTPPNKIDFSDDQIIPRCNMFFRGWNDMKNQVGKFLVVFRLGLICWNWGVIFRVHKMICTLVTPHSCCRGGWGCSKQSKQLCSSSILLRTCSINKNFIQTNPFL